LIWGLVSLPEAEASYEFREIEQRLLRSETFSEEVLSATLERAMAQHLSACNTRLQRAIVLIAMPLADAALRSGATAEFDRRIGIVEDRARHILSCSPRDGFGWLVLFNLRLLRALLDKPTFDLLAMSYETAPNEAWISVRRNPVSLPLVVLAPDAVREHIFQEFQQLIRHGFVDVAAQSYLRSSAPIRDLINLRIQQLDVTQQKKFSEALQKTTR